MVDQQAALDRLRELYRKKNEHLEKFLEPVEPYEFYREIFPEGSFERKGHFEDRKGNGIAVTVPKGEVDKATGIALQIERKAEDCYKAEYARRHLGECYEGRISGVTQRGLFIELENGVEGFVPASSLTATGTMLTEGVRLSDPVSGKNWNLGDTMMITIVRADVNLGKIDFEVAPESAKQ